MAEGANLIGKAAVLGGAALDATLARFVGALRRARACFAAGDEQDAEDKGNSRMSHTGALTGYRVTLWPGLSRSEHPPDSVEVEMVQLCEKDASQRHPQVLQFLLHLVLHFSALSRS
jgi:hypothetical protein